MNELPRQKLCELMVKYGESLCDEPLRLEGLLRDVCGKFRLEINLFINALKEGVATDLRNSSDSYHPDLLIARLAKRLQDHHGVNEDTARWIVESWALALGKISKNQLTPARAVAQPAAPAPQKPSYQPPSPPRRREPEPAPAGYSFQQPTYQAPTAPITYPAPKRSKVWMYAAGVVVLVCLGGAAAWYFKLIPSLKIPPREAAKETPKPETTVAPEVEATPAVAAKTVRPLPADAKASFDKGVTAAAAGEWTLAAKYFGEARNGAPYSDEVLFHLAEAESKIPDRELRALAWFKAYLAAAPNGDKVNEARTQVSKLEVNIEGTIQRLVGQGKQMAMQISNTGGSSTDYSGLREVAQVQAGIGDISGAAATANQIPRTEYYFSSAYQSIVSAQAQAGDFSGARSTLYGLSDGSAKVSAYIEIARAQAKAGDTSQALSTLGDAKDAARQPDNKYSEDSNYSSVGQAQAELGDISGAARTMALISQANASYKGSIQAAIAIAEIAKAKNGSLDEARRVTLSISAPSSRTSALRNLIAEYIKQKKYDEAKNLIDSIDDKEYYKGAAYQEVIDALHSAGKTAEARQLLGKARSKLNHLSPLALSYLRDSAIALDDFDTAKAIIQAMKPNERESSMDDYLSAYAVAKAKAGDLSSARSSVEQIKSDYRRSSAVDGILKAQLQKNDLAEAIRTADLLSSASSRSYAIQSIIKAQLQKGDVKEALRTADSLSDAKDRSQRQVEIVEYLVKMQHSAEAEKVAQTIQDAKYRDDSYEKIAQGAAGIGQFAESERIAELINNVAQRAKLCCSIGSYQQSAGYLGKDIASLKRAAELTATVGDASDKAGCYRDVASYYRSAGKLVEAQQNIALARAAAMTVSDPIKRFSAIDNLSYLEDRCLTPGEVKKSEALALDTIANIKESEKSSPYWSVARRLAREGDIAGAKEIAAAVLDNYYSKYIPRDIGEIQAQKGNVRAAEQTAAQLKEASDRDDVYYYIAQAQVKAGDLHGAERTLGNITPENSYNGSCGVLVATAYLKKNDLSGAKRCADKVADPSKLLDHTLFEQIEKSGQLELGKQIIAKAEPKIAKDNWSGWGSLAEAKIKVGDADGAKRAVSMITTTDYEYYKRHACELLAEAGEIEWAKQNVTQLKERESQVAVWLVIAKGQAKRGDKQGAEKTLSDLSKQQLTIYQIINLAAVRNSVAGLEAAREVLASAHPRDADFEGWADYELVSYTEDATAAKKIADEIKDATWKSQAYASVMWKVKDDPAAQKAIAAAISDPLYKSDAYDGLGTKEVERGDLDKAIQLANLVPVADLKLTALHHVLAAAVAREEFGVAEKILQSLSNSDSKAYMAMTVAKASVAVRKNDLFARCIQLAKKSAETMPDGVWKARAFDQIAIIAMAGNDKNLSQAASKTALRLAAKLQGDDKENWDNYTFARLPSPEEATKQAEAQKRAEEYAKLVESDLKDQLYTDFAGYMRSVQAKGKQSEVLSGTLEAARDIADKFKKIQKIGTPVAAPKS